MRSMMLAAGLTMALVGCAGSSSEGASADVGPTTTAINPAACSDLFAEGTITDPAMWALPCADADGALVLDAASTTDCAAGPQLAWNDEGWGYIGQPWHRHQSGGEKVAPASERELCETGPTTAPPATAAPTTAVYYASCADAEAAGAAPIYRGEPGYSSNLDRDDDGIACDQQP